MSQNKKILLVILGLVAGASITGLIIGARSDQNEPGASESAAQNQIKITPPSPAEQAEIQDDEKSQVIIINLGQDANTVFVRAIVNGAKTGNCELTFTKPGQNDITSTVPLRLAGSSYTCQGFDLSKSQFTAQGEWKVRVALSGSQKVEPATRNLTIE